MIMSEKKIDTKKLMILGLIVALCMMVVPVMAALLPADTCPEDKSFGRCTAKDVLTNVTNVEILNGGHCDPVYNNVTVDFTVTFDSTASQRYNLGMFVAQDGKSLQGNPVAAKLCSAGYAPVPPFGILDGNYCGDMNQSQILTWQFTVNASCANIQPDGTLEIPACRFWTVPGHDVCPAGPNLLPGANADWV